MNRVNRESPIPKYYQVYSALLGLIESGEIPPGSALPPTSALTQRFGVSRITLTKAMDMLDSEGIVERHQGKGTFVCENAPPARCIIAIMNGHHRLSSRFERQYLWQAILDGVQLTASKHDHTLNLVGRETYVQQNGSLAPTTMRNQANGLIYHPASDIIKDDFAFVESLINRGFPVVLVDRQIDGLTADHVLFDNEEAAYALTEALINRGHQHIAFALTPEPNASSVQDRLSGYRLALESNGLAYDEALVLDLYSQEVRDTHPLLLDQIETQKLTAVVTANDQTTETLLFDLVRLNHDRLKEISLRAGSGLAGDPRLEEINLEIAMIGDVISPYYRHYVSFIARHSGHRLGAAAAELLIGRIMGKITGPPQTVIVPMEIIELKSE